MNWGTVRPCRERSDWARHAAAQLQCPSRRAGSCTWSADAMAAGAPALDGAVRFDRFRPHGLRGELVHQFRRPRGRAEDLGPTAPAPGMLERDAVRPRGTFLGAS